MTEGMIEGQYYQTPHCNAEVLHVPGQCYYCDQFPSRQAVRVASGRPFTPPEANGWSGNVAVKAGEVHEHLGARWTVGENPRLMSEPRCQRFTKFGWYCRRRPHATGPCAGVPRWWNMVERLRVLRNGEWND